MFKQVLRSIRRSHPPQTKREIISIVSFALLLILKRDYIRRMRLATKRNKLLVSLVISLIVSNLLDHLKVISINVRLSFPSNEKKSSFVFGGKLDILRSMYGARKLIIYIFMLLV